MELLYNILNYGLERYAKYYSSYRGTVVDTDDPLELGRVRVLVPQVHGKSTQGILAWQKGVWHSDDCGIKLPIQPGDMVWVEFEYGNPAYPIWSYAHNHNNIKTPEEFTDKVYGFKSPEGIVVTADDENDTVIIKNKDGSSITISPDKILIDYKENDTIELVNGNINITSDQVKVRSGDIQFGQVAATQEPLVLGNQQKLFLQNLLTFLSTFTVLCVPSTPVLPTPPSLPNPANAAALSALQAQLELILSNTSKTN